MSEPNGSTSTNSPSRLLGLVEQVAETSDVPSSPTTFDPAEVTKSAVDPDAFWCAATSTLHSISQRENAVGLISALLDHAIVVHEESKAENAVPLFSLLEEAFQVLPLEKMRQLISFLELRRTRWVSHAQGEASIVLLRIGRTLLNRLEPKLHAHDTGRVLAYLALSKGLAHASRLNRKGLLNLAWVKPVSGEKFSIEYAVSALQDATALAKSPELEQFLADVLHRIMRLTLEPVLRDATAWSGLTWEQAEQTLNGLVFVFVLMFAIPTVKKTDNSNALTLVERIEDRIDKILASLDLSAAAERLTTRESEWSNWRLRQYARSEKPPAELPQIEPTDVPNSLQVPPLQRSLGNSKLTRLWSVNTGLERFEETVNWAAKAEEFEGMSKTDTTYEFMALRCRPWTELVHTFESTPAQEYDMSEWEAKLPKEQPPALPVKEPLKRTSEHDEPAPKRARMSYEEPERPSAVDRQRAMASTARPLPY